MNRHQLLDHLARTRQALDATARAVRSASPEAVVHPHLATALDELAVALDLLAPAPASDPWITSTQPQPEVPARLLPPARTTDTEGTARG